MGVYLGRRAVIYWRSGGQQGKDDIQYGGGVGDSQSPRNSDGESIKAFDGEKRAGRGGVERVTEGNSWPCSV